jgi:hypothetical protein
VGQAIHKPEEGAARLTLSLQRSVRRLGQGVQPNSVGARQIKPMISSGKPTDALFDYPVEAGTMVWDDTNQKPWWSDGFGGWWDALGNP